MEDDKKKNNSRIVSFDAAVRNGHSEEDDEIYSQTVRKHRRTNRIAFGILFAIVIGMILYFLVIRKSEPYSAIGVEWEQQILTGANQKYINFNGGILQYGPEGANYYTSANKTTWAASYSMTNPKAVCQEKYALVYDEGAKSAVVLNADSGQVGVISTDEIVTKGTVSAYGAVALMEEEKLSNTICFFDNSGKQIDITSHTQVSKSGYPVDIAFSPDGQMLMTSFVYMDSGVAQSQIVFYNFDEKRSTTGIVGAYKQYGDTLFADVAFLSNDRAVALGDGCVVFYSLKNKIKPEELKVIRFDEEITGATYSDCGLALAVRNGELASSRKLYCYDADGKEMFITDSNFDIQTMLLTKNGLYLISDMAISYLDQKGKTYFTGSLECDILKLNNPNEDNELLLVTNQRVVFLKLFRG